MNRAELRRQKRAEEKKKKVYTLTQGQLDKVKQDAVEAARKEVEKKKQEITAEAIDQAMVLLLTIPLKVLIRDYWPKTAYKRGQEFTNKVLELYHQWEAGEVSMDDLRADLWEYGGVRFEYRQEEQ